MKIRAVIFDIYDTVLQVGPPPADAAARWKKLWAGVAGEHPGLSLEEFAEKARAQIAREHAAARAVGIAFPEVFWPSVVVGVLPELARLKPKQLEIFLIEHAQLRRKVRLMPGAADGLRAMLRARVALGIASNSQPYTLHELDASLAGAGLRRKLFRHELCFFSFEAGFSKPDPHVFRWLAARLNVAGIAPVETLMVGNHLENDIEPAEAHGIQTWQLTGAPTAAASLSGNWPELGEFVASRNSR